MSRIDNFDNPEVVDEIEEDAEASLPYLMFKIADVMYAVNGAMINSIFVLEQPVTRVPMTEAHVRGIINVRGEVVPIIDMRVLFGLPTAQEDNDNFMAMIDKRKQDHIDWVTALRNTIENDAPFTLATSPHQCAFGKWYDTYETNILSVSHYLKQIDEPHTKLHASAGEAFACQRLCESCERIECKQDALRKATEEYAPRLLELLDHLKSAYDEGNTQMVVVLQDGDVQMGILVDEVVEVSDISDVFSLNQMPTSHRSQFVTGVGTAEHMDREILMLDVSAVIQCT